MFKDIKNFPNYEINVKGVIRNKKYNRELKMWVNKQGYYTSGLSFNGVYHSIKVHRMIAIHFLPEPSEELKTECAKQYPFVVCVNHKDGNKLNNSLNNLEWCTHEFNTKHAWSTGLTPPRIGELNGRSILTEDLVHNICKFYEQGGLPKEAITMFGISRQQSTKIRAGYAWKHIWKQYNIKVNRRVK